MKRKRRIGGLLLVCIVMLMCILQPVRNVKAAEKFLWPVPGYTNVSQGYHNNHKAIDIAQWGIEGKGVVAVKSGVVVDAKDTCSCGAPYVPCTCNGEQGNYVIIKHNDGGLSRYLHLQYGSVSVRIGQSIVRGAQIGKVGASGGACGVHLHFDLATGSTWNRNNRYNPMSESYEYSNGGENTTVSLTINPIITKTTMNVKETCIVGGTVSSTGSNITSVTAGVYRNSNGTGGAVNGIEVTRKPNSTWYNVSNMDSGLYFQNISEPGTYYFVVKATLANGTSDHAYKQFTVKGNQCGQPTINSPTNIASGKQLTITVGSSDTVNYTVKRDGIVVDNGTASKEFKKSYTVAGKYSVSAYATRAGYTKSNTKTIDFNIEKVASPKINQSVTDNHMAVNIVSDTSGAAIYYTTSGNTPTTSSTRYNGTLTLNEQKTIKAIAVKNGMANSAVTEHTVKMEEPEAPTGLTLVGADKIPQGDTTSVKWNKVQLASGYTATLYKNGEKVKSVTTAGTTASFVLEDEGAYKVNVYASNFVGNSTETNSAVDVKAIAPSTVSFKDWDGSIISSQEVKYGHDATVPKDPERRGYTFLYWKDVDKAVSVKEDQEITALYKINTYTVRFYNGSGNQVGATQKVNYMESAKSPEADLNDIPTGYVFAGWKVIQASDDSTGDYKAVDSDMKLQAVYYWHNNELPIVAEITAARQNVKTGNYNVTVKLTNYPEDTTTAILRVSLLTKDGKMVKTTKSEVEVEEDGTTTKTVTLKYSGIATKASAVILGMSGDDLTSSAYSKEVEAEVTVQSNEVWSDWSEWTTTKPEGLTDDAIESITQYRYADKTTTTSTNSSMSGWTQYNKTTSWNNWGSWSGWSETKQTASDSKQVESRTEYRYYAYVCPVCGGREPFTGMSDCHKYSLSAANCQITWSPVAYKDSKPTGYSYTTLKLHTTSIGDGKNWNFSAGNRYHTAPGTKDASGPDAVVIRTAYRYRTRSQTTTYHYYKWNDWSDWSETVYTESDTRKVETRTLYRTRGKVPVYSPLAGTEEPVGNVYHIKGSLASISEDLSGKLATVMVYKGKNTDPNEDQIQYVGQTTIGENNAYEFDVIPKVDPTPVTGDFTVALGIQGSTGLVNVDVIRYERPVYTVEYLNDDGSVISTQRVEEGTNAKLPERPKKAGSYFVGWSETATNVQADMTITAMYTPIEYVVVYIDSANDVISYDTHLYGDKLTPPENPTAEGKIFTGWDSVLDGKDTVTGNMVVNSVYETEIYTVNFLDENGKIVSSQNVEYGKAAALPVALDVTGREFMGWSTDKEWWHVTEDMEVTPILSYLESVDAPTYEIITYDNCLALYFETSTEEAKIYYTLDGTIPNKNSCLYDGNPILLYEFELHEYKCEYVEEYDEENNLYILYRTAYINAIATKEGMNDSEVQKIIYKDVIQTCTDITEATITFEVNGGKALTENTKTVEIGAEYGELPTPAYVGYDFDGWYTGAEDGAKIEAEDICSKDITLYAHWTKNDEVHEHTIVIDEAVEATCQQTGATEGRHCSECDEVLVEQKTIPVTDHKWNVKSVDKEATCSETGKITYICEYCDTTKTETVEKTDHKAENIEGIPAVEATCTTAGKTAGSYCTVCGETIVEQEDIPKLGHSYREWVEVKAATCQENGQEERSCETCGEKETNSIEKVDHVSETRNAAEVSCAIDGYTGDEYCSVCGELLELGEAIAKTEHNWNTGKVVTEATCQKEGIIYYTCRICGEKKYEDIPAGTHSGGKATCSKKAVCTYCSKEYGELNSSNHAGGTEVRDQVEATTTETGYTGDTYCLGCGKQIKTGKEIPVLPDENQTVIRVQSATVSPGEDITIPVMLENNSGIAGFSFDISYDSTILTLKSVVAGSVLSTGQVSTNGNVINWYTTDNVTGVGEMLKVTFCVAEDAETSEVEISLAPHEGKKNLVDEMGNYVEANYQPGTVSVEKGAIGDINGDADITIGDVVVLNRAVLGKQEIADSIFMLADINDDGDITIGDVVILNRHVLGKEDLMVAREYLLALGDFLGAGGTATISVDDAVVEAGDTFDLPVWIEENTGLAGIALKFEVPEGFVLNSITQSDLLLKGSFSVDGNTCTWYAQKNVSADGELLILNVTATENAKSGTVSVGVKDDDGNNFTDEHGASMLVEFTAGSIKVKEPSACETNGHTADEAVKENEQKATCKEDGSYDLVTYCAVCGEEIAREAKTIPAEHDWNSEYTVEKQATCTENGKIVYACSVCGDTKDEVVESTGHKYGTTVTSSTCVAQGYTTHVCEKCGDTYKDTYVAQLAHQWKEVIDKAATVTETGLKHEECITCKTKKNENTVIEKLQDTTVVPPAEEENKTPLTKEEQQIVDILGLTVKGAKEIQEFAKANNIPEKVLLITDASIKKQTAEENANATYGKLQARATKATSSKITLKWTKVSGADGYLVYGNKCGKANKYKLLKTLSNKKVSYTQSKLKKGTYYKYFVVAYKLIDGKKVTIAAAKTIHEATTGKRYCNVKAVKVNKSTISIKVKKSFTLKASEVKTGKTLSKHRKIAFESTNPRIATVSSRGKIVGKKKGNCYVYAYAQNGVYKKVKVKVK